MTSRTSIVRAGCFSFAVLVGGLLVAVSSASAATYYWFGDDNSFWNTIAGPGGTNWSSSPDFNNGTGGATALPGSTDDVFFVLNGANNLTTELGASFSIGSLTFTSDATNPVQINDSPGTHSLTIGTGGITDNGPSSYTINAGVALGGVQTWANNTANPLTVNGVISGAAGNNLTLGGTGLFTFGGANTYSGSTSIFTGGLTLSGNGSILNTSAISLNAGTLLTLDNTTTNVNRIGATTTITSNGGFINLLGNSSTSTAQSAGTLAVNVGATYVTVTPGSGQSAALTFGSAGVTSSFSHAPGGTVTFSSTGTINAPNVTLINTAIPANAIIGGWATIGTTANPNGPLDWATVNGSGNVVPLASYQPLVPTPLATDNAQLLAGAGPVTLSAGNNTINSLSLGDTLLFTNQGDTLTIASGGIISYGGTGTANYQGNTYRPISNFATIGRTIAQQNGTSPQYFGNITSSTSDLTIFTAGNLQLSSVITGNINLVKSGPGVLDLSTGNDQTKSANTYTGKTIINEGIVIVGQETHFGAAPTTLVRDAITLNGGQIESFSSLNFSANRGITLGTRGGIISGVAGTGDTLNQPITGTGGLTVWTDGFLATTGNTAGRIQFNNASATNPNNYQGPTTFWVTPCWNSPDTFDTTTVTGTQGRIDFNQNNNIPSTSAVTANLVDQFGAVLPNPYGPDGTLRYYEVRMNGKNESFGSLAGNLALTSHTGVLTLGGNNLSATYTGVIGGTLTSGTTIGLGTGSVIKVGTGTQTFGGANLYTGNTSINGGTLLIGNGTAVTDSVASLANTAVTVGNGTLTGALGGNGTINGTVSVTSTGHLSPAMTPTTFNTLTINNDLTIAAGGTLDYNFAAPGNGDLLTLTGAGNLSLAAGTDSLNITQLPGFGIGLYPLITVAGTGMFTDNAAFTINGKPNFNYLVLKPGAAIDPTAGGGTVPVGELALEVLQGNPNLTWIGNISNAWDINTTANWSGDATKFTTGANVAFDDFATGGHNNPIAVVAGGVNANSIVFNGSGTGAGGQDFTFSGGAITVNTSITKNQAGSVTFNDNVTAPTTIISAGGFIVGAATTYNSSTKLDLNGGTLTVNGTLNTPALTVKSSAILNVSSGGLLGSGTLLSNNGAATFNQPTQTLAGISGAGSLALNGTALTLASGLSSYSGQISGTAASLRVNGATADVTLSGNNTYSGGTSVTAGILRAGSLTAFGSNPALTISGAGTLDVNGIALNGSVYTNVSVGGAGVGGNGAIVNNGPVQNNALANVTLTADTTFGGTTRWDFRPTGVGTATVTGGGFNVTKTGTNAVGLATASELVTGVKDININQGTLVVADTGTINNNVAGSIFLNPTGTLSVGNYASLTGPVINKPFVMNGGTLQTDSTGTNGNATLTTGISLNAVGNIAAQSGSTLTLNSAIVNGASSTSGVSYSGAGTIALGVASNYGGPTTVTAATLRNAAGVDNVLPTATDLTLNGAVLDLNGHSQLLNSLSGASTITSGAAGNSTLTINGALTTQYAGAITNGAGTVAVVKSGTGNQTLSGQSTYSGGTTVNGPGTLSVGGAGSLALFNPLGTGQVTLAGGKLALKGQVAPVAGLTANLYDVTLTPPTNVNNSDPDYASLSTLTAHLASLGPPTVSVPTSTNGKSNFDFSNNAYGNGAPFNSPGGTTGDFGFTNTLNFEAYFNGYINITTPGTYTFSTTSDDGSMVFIDGQDTPVVNNNGFQAATTKTGTVNFTTTGYHQISVGYYQAGGGTGLLVQYAPPGGSTTTIPNSVLATAGSSFAGTQTYGNNFVVTDNTTIDVSNSLNAAIGPVSIGAKTLSLTGTAGASLATGNVTLSGNATFDQAAGTTFAPGPIGETGGARSITKTGLGSLNLTAGGTYSGATTISAGELRVTNATGSATGSGTTTIASAATLSGTGTAGAVILNGHLSPGIGAGAIGTIGMGATTFAAASNLDLDLSSSGNDLANVGALTLGGNVNVNLNLLPLFTLGSYTLVTSTSITGAPSFTVTHSGPGDNPAFASLYSVSQVGNNIVLNVTAPVQTWKGNSSAAWNTTDVNWTPTTVNGGKYADNSFQEVFDDNGSAHPTISIPANVSPLAVKFANTNAVTYTIGGVGSAAIAGAGVVTIAGPGTVNLNSSNTYTGGTNLLGGTLNLGDPAGSPIGSGLLRIAGGTIDNTSGSSMTLANAGEIWSGSFMFTGTNDLDPGTGPITLTANPTVTVAHPNAYFNIDAAAIGDGGHGYGFTKAGPGFLQLSVANTYSGTTTVTEGSLQVFVDNALGGGSAPLTVTGGTLYLAGTNQSVGPVYTSAGTIQTGTLTATAFTIDNPADLAMDSSLVLAGSGLLTKQNTGMLTLAGMTNSYSGGTTINQSTVSIDADANLGTPATLTLNGGTLLVTAGTAANAAAGTATLSSGRGITLGANGGTISIGFTNPTPTLASETALVYNGVISGPGGLTVVGIAGVDQANQSILDISAHATYQGNTTINSAVAQVGSGTAGVNGAAVINVLPTTTVLNLINNGAWNIDSGVSSLTVAGLTGDATGRFGTTNGVFGGNNLTISGSGTYTFPGVIGAITVAGKTGSDALLSLTMNGAGTQILGGVNTYTGTTTVNRGTLSLGIANAINSGSPLVLGGGKLATGGFNQSLNTLTLSASSAIDLGTGAGTSVFNFADSHLVPWTAGSNLSIFNWSGSLSGGGNDQLIFGIDNTGLTSTQVGQIHFQGFNGATILANGEVVPVSASTRLLGDWNLDGKVTTADITSMLGALTNLSAYESATSPLHTVQAQRLTADDLLNVGDVNSSGSVDNADIQGLINLLANAGGGGGSSVVPEPTSLILMSLGLVICAAARYRRGVFHG